VFQHPKHCCLLTLKIWELFPRDSPSSFLSENSYRRETFVVLFHLQVRFLENENNVGAREQCLMTIIPVIWEVEGGGLWFKAILGRE
jgi:hypothetical protein